MGRKRSGYNSSNNTRRGGRSGEIQATVLHTVDEKVFKDGKEKNVIRVIHWGRGKPTLEKRNFYKADDGFRPGKQKGLTLDDLEVIEDQWDDVMDALEGKKPTSTSRRPRNEEPDDDDDYGDEDEDDDYDFEP